MVDSSAAGQAEAYTAFQARTFSDTAIQLLRERILMGQYGPGERLNELALSEQFRISRSPIREALKVLAGQGLVQIVAGRGAFVTDFEPDEIRQLGEVRVALESRAASLAAARATSQQLETIGGLLTVAEATVEHDAIYPPDADFHAAVIEASCNARLVAVASDINTQFRLARARSGRQPERAPAAYKEHIAIFEALKARDANTAAEAMETHLTNSTNNILEMIGNAKH